MMGRRAQDQTAGRMPRRTRRERGIALLSVLWVGVAMGALCAALLSLSRSDLDLARNLAARTEAELAADSAARTAIYALVNQIGPVIAADGSVSAWRLPDAEVRVEVTSEYGRLDVNLAQPEILAQLIEAAGAEPGEAARLAAAILDFIDADDFLTPLGAERREYAAAGLAGPKDAPLVHEDELLAVLGMPSALYSRLSDALTVYSRRVAPKRGQEHPLWLAAFSGAPLPGAEAALPPAFSVSLGDEPETLRAGTVAAPSDLVRIRAEAVMASGARAVRIAVVSVRPRNGERYSVLAWRKDRPRLFPG